MFNYADNIQVIPAEDVPPCPKCKSLQIMIVEIEKRDFAACLKCNHEWEVSVKSWKLEDYA